MIIIVGPFPPPIQGAALITERFKDELEANKVPFLVCSTAPRVDARGFAYALSRVRSYVRCCRAILVARRRPERTAVYISLSGGLGLIYDLVVVAAARLKRYDL